MPLSNAQRIQQLLDFFRDLDKNNTEDYMASFQPHLSLVSADDYPHDAGHLHHPRVTFAYTVQPMHCNRMGNMHGGAVATLFDYCTSLALALDALPKTEGADDADDAEDDNVQSWRRLGVSRTLSVTYVRPAPAGTAVLIECEVVHGGKRMSSLRAIMRRASDKAVLSTCDHGKVVDAKL